MISSPAVIDRDVSLNTLAGTRAVAELCRPARIPGQFLQRHAVPIGGEQRDGVVVDFDPYAGKDGQQLIASSGNDHLRDGLGKAALGTVPVASGIAGSEG